jgi:hypothetical protein
MNRSYRTVWNEALGAWVAISEISSARGKKSSSKVTLAAAAVGVLVGLMGVVPMAAQATGSWNADNTNLQVNGGNGGNISIAGVTPGANASVGAAGDIAIGASSVASGGGHSLNSGNCVGCWREGYRLSCSSFRS